MLGAEEVLDAERKISDSCRLDSGGSTSLNKHEHHVEMIGIGYHLFETIQIGNESPIDDDADGVDPNISARASHDFFGVESLAVPLGGPRPSARRTMAGIDAGQHPERTHTTSRAASKRPIMATSLVWPVPQTPPLRRSGR